MDPDGNQLVLTNELSEQEREIVEEFKKQVISDPEKLTQHNALLFESQTALLESWRKDRDIRK